MWMANKRRNCMNPSAVPTITLGLCPDAKVFEILPTGLAALDAVIQGFPRGAISEITGGESSGRTTLAHSLLAAATSKLEICAYIDTSDSFDPVTAAAAGITLRQLLWIRCGKDAEHALKATDYLLHAGGLGVVALDLCQVSSRILDRIPISYWHRFRRAVENTPTILALVEKQPMAKSCATLRLEMKRKKTVWTGAPGFQIFSESELEAVPHKPVRSSAHFKVKALA